MSKNFWSLAGFTASLLAGSALAQTSGASSDWWNMDWAGAPYVGAKIGGNWSAENTRLNDSLLATPYNRSANYNDGYIGAIQGGFAWNNGLRLELEGSERYNDVNTIRTPYGSYAGRGSMRDYAAMANILYELPAGFMGMPDFPLRPYIGGGVGSADYAPYHIRAANFAYPGYVSGDRWGFAWQGIAGLSYSLTDNVDLTLEYRYFARTDDNHPRGVGNDYEAQSALIGVRYSFGEPAPVVQQAAYVPPPPPQPRQTPSTARNYLVFFDFNKSDLTENARSVVDQAAANAKSNNVTRLNVTGYTDTVGSDAYNMRLSRRRAESVASELEAQGVPSSDIAIFAKGKHDLLVPTGDGVREPQNRRVQIVYEGGPTS
jgi:outer membrane protein OmpA-like peptidoglycan-associated protein